MALAVVVALAVAACGDDGDGDASPSPTITGAAAKRGQQLAGDNGCHSCHTTDGRRSTGPTWKDLAGSEEELDGDRTVPADDAYLARSITDPNADVVAGFPAIMPSGHDFSDADVRDLVAYLRQLSAHADGGS